MNPHEPAARSDVVQELGPLDDLTVAKILELGPTVASLVEARVYLAEGEPVRGPRRSPGPVVERIVDLVRDALAEDPDESADLPLV